MKIRVIYGTIMAVGAILIFYLGGIYVKGLAIVLLALGLYEILGLVRKNQWSILIDIIIYIYSYYMLLFDRSSNMFNGTAFFLILLILLFLSLMYEDLTIQDVFYLITMSTFLSVAGKAIISIDEMYHYAGMIYIAMANYGCDSGAYFVGVKFGKHKLIPRISPKKTIEGSIGGMVIGTLLSVLVGVFFKLNLPLIEMIVLAFLMTIFAQIGDLTFSSIKRHYNVKDYSNLIPGHGGVLDRLDSLLFNILAFSLWLTLFH